MCERDVETSIEIVIYENFPIRFNFKRFASDVTKRLAIGDVDISFFDSTGKICA